MQLKKVNPSLKILISIGGWLVKSTPFIRVMRDKEHLKIFIKNVLEFLQHWKFDGLDVKVHLNFQLKLIHFNLRERFFSRFNGNIRVQ